MSVPLFDEELEDDQATTQRLQQQHCLGFCQSRQQLTSGPSSRTRTHLSCVQKAYLGPAGQEVLLLVLLLVLTLALLSSAGVCWCNTLMVMHWAGVSCYDWYFS
jgi:hypothetical protein